MAALPPPRDAATASDRRWTAAEVRRLIADSPLATPRYELVDGELLVTPSPSGAHQGAVALLSHALAGFLEREPVGRVLTSPFDVELEPETLVQPDLFVLPAYESRRVLSEMPARELHLAAEILSPSSGRYDRVTKRLLYTRRVPEYWIVDPGARLVERWRRGDERPEIVVDTLEWQPSGASTTFRLELPRWFARVFEEE